MKEVKIITQFENIEIPMLMGLKRNQRHEFLTLVFHDNNELVQDGFYTLMQGETQKTCRICSGEVRGTDWLDSSKPIFIVE
jgi:hypothetical protein